MRLSDAFPYWCVERSIEHNERRVNREEEEREEEEREEEQREKNEREEEEREEEEREKEREEEEREEKEDDVKKDVDGDVPAIHCSKCADKFSLTYVSFRSVWTLNL